MSKIFSNGDTPKASSACHCSTVPAFTLPQTCLKTKLRALHHISASSVSTQEPLFLSLTLLIDQTQEKQKRDRLLNGFKVHLINQDTMRVQRKSEIIKCCRHVPQALDYAV